MGTLDDVFDNVGKVADEEIAKMKAKEAAREQAAKDAEQKIQAGVQPKQ